MKKTKRQRSSESITLNKSLSLPQMLLSKPARRPNKQPSKRSSPLQHSSSHESAITELSQTVNLNSITSQVIFNLSCIGDTEPEKVDEGNNVENESLTHTSSVMDVDALLSRSSVIDMTAGSSDDQETTNEKLIKATEDKICTRL